jgi:NTE family protein
MSPTTPSVAANNLLEPSQSPTYREGGAEEGIGLCLSGGGYRAMLFHLGTLWRLAETGYLGRLDRISSVSGGSIVAAMVGLRWSKLKLDRGSAVETLKEHVVGPIRKLAGRTIDAGSIITGVLFPGSIADKVASAYSKYLYGNATLADLPEAPRFVINATNVQTGVLWRFSKPYMGDYRVGLIRNPKISLAVVVGASSAFPPLLSPATIDVDPGDFDPETAGDLQREPYTTTVVLTDGGVYDNMGVETVWKRYRTVLVSDAGGQVQPETDPKHDWGRHAYRVLNLIDNQVRSLRKRQIIESYKDAEDAHIGAYWGIRTNIANYPVETTLPCPFDRTTALADTPTRLKALPGDHQERLINWGYAVCDAALRAHVDQSISAAKQFPYPARGI